MQEQLGHAVGQTYDGDYIYKFADGWGITSRRDILRFAEYNQRWQTPNRAVVLSEVLDINSQTLISDILNNIIDLRALVVDNFFIDLCRNFALSRVGSQFRHARNHRARRAKQRDRAQAKRANKST